MASGAFVVSLPRSQDVRFQGVDLSAYLQTYRGDLVGLEDERRAVGELRTAEGDIDDIHAVRANGHGDIAPAGRARAVGHSDAVRLFGACPSHHEGLHLLARVEAVVDELDEFRGKTVTNRVVLFLYQVGDDHRLMKHRFQDGAVRLGEDYERLLHVVHGGAFDENPFFRDVYVGNDLHAEAGSNAHIINCRTERSEIKGTERKVVVMLRHFSDKGG